MRAWRLHDAFASGCLRGLPMGLLLAPLFRASWISDSARLRFADFAHLLRADWPSTTVGPPRLRRWLPSISRFAVSLRDLIPPIPACFVGMAMMATGRPRRPPGFRVSDVLVGCHLTRCRRAVSRHWRSLGCGQRPRAALQWVDSSSKVMSALPRRRGQVLLRLGGPRKTPRVIR